jgi:hypothetical protein
MADPEKRSHSKEKEGSTGGNDAEAHDESLSDTSSTAGSLHAVRAEKESSSKPGYHDGQLSSPDINHEEAEGAVPGHELAVELGQVSSDLRVIMMRQHRTAPHH